MRKLMLMVSILAVVLLAAPAAMAAMVMFAPAAMAQDKLNCVEVSTGDAKMIQEEAQAF